MHLLKMIFFKTKIISFYILLLLIPFLTNFENIFCETQLGGNSNTSESNHLIIENQDNDLTVENQENANKIIKLLICIGVVIIGVYIYYTYFPDSTNNVNPPNDSISVISNVPGIPPIVTAPIVSMAVEPIHTIVTNVVTKVSSFSPNTIWFPYDIARMVAVPNFDIGHVVSVSNLIKGINATLPPTHINSIAMRSLFASIITLRHTVQINEISDQERDIFYHHALEVINIIF